LGEFESQTKGARELQRIWWNSKENPKFREVLGAVRYLPDEELEKVLDYVL
jgi:hypothetical protein